MQSQPRVVVVGAGFAGAATAWALAERGVRDVTVLEAEPVIGAHGSGKNAAMARRVIEDPLMSQLAADGVDEMVALQERRGERFLDPVGGMIIGSEADVTRLSRGGAPVTALASSMRMMPIGEAAELVGVLRGAAASHALLTAGSGVVDIHALLSALLDEAKRGGARVRLSSPLLEVHVESGRVTGVETATGPLPCDLLVNAAGFSANRVAQLAAAAPLDFRPVRRHLFTTEALDGVDGRWPFVWDVTGGVYFRPEGRGLLMCSCDQTPWPQGAPHLDPAERERLAERFSDRLPALSDARPSHAWACVRVLTPDGRFAIGANPQVQGLFWVAGLGGHGMTTSLGVGRLAAAGLLDGALPAPWAEAFAPARLALPRG